MKVSELKAEMDDRFARVDEDLNELRQEVKTQGETTRRYFDVEVRQLVTAEGDAIRQEVRQLVKADGEVTRRYFDVEFRQLVKAESEATRRYFDVEVRQLLTSEADAIRQEVRQLVKADGEVTRRYFDVEFRQLVTAEGEATRRHFDVMVDTMKDERNLVLDQTLATAERVVAQAVSNTEDHRRFDRRLDDHDRRLETLEQSPDRNRENR